MLNINILVGTMTGTAQLVAQEIELAYADAQSRHRRHVHGCARSARVRAARRIPHLHVDLWPGRRTDNAKAFYADLAACRESLAHVNYGVFALGDSTHVGTYCFGGRRFDEALAARGAQRIGEVMQHNASGGTLPEDVALEWFPEWLRQVRAAFEAAEADAAVAAQDTRPAGD